MMFLSIVVRRTLRLALAGCVGAGATAAAAYPTQSWNGYHWARTGPLSITIGDNVSSVWDPYLATAANVWTTANNIEFVKVAGKTSAAKCNPVYGGVQACSGDYGKTGWLGYATVWTSGGFIVQATVKLNDYYFNQARYNTDDWRSLVSCQEVGHTLGLAHADTNNGNTNLGTCMDYTNDPSGTNGTNGTLANTTASASDFAALDGIYAVLDKTQLSYTKPQSRGSNGSSQGGETDDGSLASASADPTYMKPDYRTGDGYSFGEDIDAEPTALPEPASWALLITGFAATGTALRRTRRQAAALA